MALFRVKNTVFYPIREAETLILPWKSVEVRGVEAVTCPSGIKGFRLWWQFGGSSLEARPATATDGTLHVRPFVATEPRNLDGGVMIVAVYLRPIATISPIAVYPQPTDCGRLTRRALNRLLLFFLHRFSGLVIVTLYHGKPGDESVTISPESCICWPTIARSRFSVIQKIENPPHCRICSRISECRPAFVLRSFIGFIVFRCCWFKNRHRSAIRPL